MAINKSFPFRVPTAQYKRTWPSRKPIPLASTPPSSRFPSMLLSMDLHEPRLLQNSGFPSMLLGTYMHEPRTRILSSKGFPSMLCSMNRVNHGSRKYEVPLQALKLKPHRPLPFIIKGFPSTLLSAYTWTSDLVNKGPLQALKLRCARTLAFHQ